MSRIKVIHLEMDGEHYYFGSLKALHDTIGRERMGMKFTSFHSNVRVKPGQPYTNRRKGYTIRMGFLVQKKTNRRGGFLLNRPEGADAKPNVSPAEKISTSKKATPTQLDLFE